jgi:glutathione peroxidase
MSKIYDIPFKAADGSETSLKPYQGKAILIVNVASKCGFTPQYDGLEKLYEQYKDKGLMVVGFPCNQFGAQEPGSDQEIQSFCKMNYGVTFPVAGTIDVNGDNTHPLYQFLKKEEPGVLGTEGIKWNFTKFLVGKDGKVLKRFAPQTKPEELGPELEKVL